MIEAAAAKSPGARTLLAALFMLMAVVWLEPRGSNLAEPDETRYAEIPREMLAAGDLIVPRLNGLPYFEKPPLLYWLNAASFSLFGETPWAARLPTRLAGLGTTALLVFAVAARRGRAAGFCAGILFLASAAGFLSARTNLTDGLLTFFFAATILAGVAAICRRENGRPWAAMAALTGAAAAAAFLTKGLIGLALPGAILFFWCLATGRMRSFASLIVSPAPPVFLALAAPWFLLVERRHPGFLNFFFIQEHVQRFATPAARRPGSIAYFVPVFLLGFSPGLPFFASALRPARLRRKDDATFLFLVWFAVVFVFFSVSRSKLPPYLFPAIPAAAALSADGIGASRRLWIVQALLATGWTAALILHPSPRAEIERANLGAILAPALVLLLLASWGAVLLAARSPAAAVAALALGWASFLAAVAFCWPRLPQARFPAELASAAKSAAAAHNAPVVGYRDYLNGFSWELKSAIPVAGYRGELEPEFEMRREVREALFWSRERFWNRWGNGQPIVALVRMKDLVELMTANPPARVLRWAEKHAVVANFGD